VAEPKEADAPFWPNPAGGGELVTLVGIMVGPLVACPLELKLFPVPIPIPLAIAAAASCTRSTLQKEKGEFFRDVVK